MTFALSTVRRRPGTLYDLQVRRWSPFKAFISLKLVACLIETVTGLDVKAFSALLLAFGIANFVGNSVSGAIVAKNLPTTMAAVPGFMFLAAICLIMFGYHFWVAAICVVLWGFAFGFIPRRLVNMADPRCS